MTIHHHTVRTRTRFFAKKGSGTFFVSQDVLYAESMQNGKQERTKAGYHHGDGILPFIYDMVLGATAAHKAP